MQNTMITNTLLKSWTGYYFGVSLEHLSNNPRHGWEPDCYFFLKKELDVKPDDWKDAKARGEIRHCKIYKNKFLDYVVKKTFETFDEWVTDAGGTMDDVLYGTNRINKTEPALNGHGWRVFDAHGRLVTKPLTAKYVELKVLLEHLGYKAPDPIIPVKAGMDEDEILKLLGQMTKLMTERDLSVHDVWIIQNNKPTSWLAYWSRV